MHRIVFEAIAVALEACGRVVLEAFGATQETLGLARRSQPALVLWPAVPEWHLRPAVLLQVTVYA